MRGVLPHSCLYRLVHIALLLAYGLWTLMAATLKEARLAAYQKTLIIARARPDFRALSPFPGSLFHGN